MKKDLADVCNYLKELVIADTPDDFVIAKPFTHGLSNDELKRGISAFRAFLHELYDKMAADKDKLDAAKAKKYDPESGEDSIQKCFPVINDIAVKLSTLGLHGRLETEPKMMLIVSGSDLLTPLSDTKPAAMNKISNKRKQEMFNYLSEAGFYFEDLNLSESIDFSKVGTFYVTYENDDYVILGLKLLAEAKENIKSGYQKFTTTFMRGDFYSLASSAPVKHMANAAEFANSQPPDLKSWIICLEKFLMDNGCKIVTFSLSNTNGGGSFAYASRKSNRTVCRINMGISGSEIVLKGNHFGDKNNILSELPESMLNVVKSVRGCGDCEARNPDTFKYCRHGGAYKFSYDGSDYECCVFEGYTFSLSEASAEERELLKKWIRYELGV